MNTVNFINVVNHATGFFIDKSCAIVVFTTQLVKYSETTVITLCCVVFTQHSVCFVKFTVDSPVDSTFLVPLALRIL